MNILLVDDDTELTALLTRYLERELFKVTAVHTAEEGLAEALSARYQAVVLDVMLPGGSGIDILGQIRTRSDVPVLMLTAKGDEMDRIQGLEIGADDYIPKPFNHRELLARVKAITRRIEHINSLSSQQASSLSVNSINVNFATREASVKDNVLSLTGTEYEILAMLVQHAGEVISKEQISEQVLGRRLAPFDRSIDMHVSNIRKKIAEHVSNERIKTMRGSGYVLIQGE